MKPNKIAVHMVYSDCMMNNICSIVISRSQSSLDSGTPQTFQRNISNILEAVGSRQEILKAQNCNRKGTILGLQIVLFVTKAVSHYSPFYFVCSVSHVKGSVWGDLGKTVERYLHRIQMNTDNCLIHSMKTNTGYKCNCNISG